MTITNDTERANLIEAGKRLAVVLDALRAKVAPVLRRKSLMTWRSGSSATAATSRAFSATRPRARAAIPGDALRLHKRRSRARHTERVGEDTKEGDIVGLDLGLAHKGVIVDAAITVPVGEVSEEVKKLLAATERALAAGIAQAIPGNHMGDISHAIQKGN